MPESHPGTPEEAEIGTVVLKGDNETVQGFIGEQYKIYQYRQDHEVLGFVQGEILCDNP
jgi:hypothetical protein